MLENIELSDVLIFVLPTIVVGILASVSGYIIKKRINKQAEVIMRTIEQRLEEVDVLRRTFIDLEQQLARERERHEKIKQAFEQRNGLRIFANEGHHNEKIRIWRGLQERAESISIGSNNVAEIGEYGTSFLRQPLLEQVRVLESQVGSVEERFTLCNVSAEQLIQDQNGLSKKIEKERIFFPRM